MFFCRPMILKSNLKMEVLTNNTPYLFQVSSGLGEEETQLASPKISFPCTTFIWLLAPWYTPYALASTTIITSTLKNVSSNEIPSIINALLIMFMEVVTIHNSHWL